MLRRSTLLFVAVSFLILAGCRGAPIYDVVGAPVATGTKPATMESVQQAILMSGTSLGWKMEPKSPGLITGVLDLRTHHAVVDITYDTKTYNIKYKDSTNLDYDGKNIHKNYNGWIENLDKAIRSNLAKT